jgi:pimeloyl-ACP methyl ester carboxylesterase
MGRIAYQVRGKGIPLVLVHGIGAGESSYEWRQNFDTLSERYCVYALDLPGFGRSERRDVNYTADLYVLALMDFLRDVVKQPAYVVASSLSSAYCVKLAQMRPELIEKLVLICPTGLETLRYRKPVWSRISYGTFSLPAIGTSIYNGIASYNYIESYLRENLYDDTLRVTPALVKHYYQMAHQPGGQFALRSFLAGMLNCDITQSYPELHQPILLIWGRYAKQTPVENASAFLEQNVQALLRIFENSAQLPHDEEAVDFNATVVDFLTNTQEAMLSDRTPAIVR